MRRQQLDSLSVLDEVGKMSEFNIISDNSQQNLKEVPSNVLQMRHLKMLYLQQNFIRALPKDFFQKLPLLTWLDLRNNHLTKIPTRVAHHQHLENMLLSDNKLETLPNELGLVPKLRVLQISNNPLRYPDNKVISEGTSGICSYLKRQYEIESCLETRESKEVANILSENDRETRKEKEIRVVTDHGKRLFPTQESVDSSLVVKGLSTKVRREDSGNVHKITTTSNKIILQSYSDEDRFARASTQTSDSNNTIRSSAKEAWIEKLKQLLEEQEKILQQERLDHMSKLINAIKGSTYRNLQALTSWRIEKRSEPLRSTSEETYRQRPPYATDDDQNAVLTKRDMHREIDRMIQYSRRPPKKDEVEKLINDLVSKLKAVETMYENSETPRSQIEDAEKQIMKIMEMHKQLVQLRKINDMVLQ